MDEDFTLKNPILKSRGRYGKRRKVEADGELCSDLQTRQAPQMTRFQINTSAYRQPIDLLSTRPPRPDGRDFGNQQLRAIALQIVKQAQLWRGGVYMDAEGLSKHASEM